jgi:hypothetical protein
MHLLGASEKMGLLVSLLTGNLSSIGTIFQSPSIWIATWMADPSVGNWTVLNNWTIKAGNSAKAAKVATKYASATSPILISSNVTLSPKIFTSSPQISFARFHSTWLSLTLIAFNDLLYLSEFESVGFPFVLAKNESAFGGNFLSSNSPLPGSWFL